MGQTVSVVTPPDGLRRLLVGKKNIHRKLSQNYTRNKGDGLPLRQGEKKLTGSSKGRDGNRSDEDKRINRESTKKKRAKMKKRKGRKRDKSKQVLIRERPASECQQYL